MNTINRKIAPPIKNATEFDFVLPPCNTFICENNIPIYSVNAGTQDVFSMEIIFDAGSRYENKYAVSQATAGLLKNGTKSKTNAQINEAIEYYGASLKVGSGADYASITLSCLSKYAEQLMPLVMELIMESIFPNHELDIYKTNSGQRLLVSLKKCDFVANRKIDEYLFGYHHPYGHYNNKEDIDALTPQDLIQFLEQNYCFDNCKIFVAGKYDEQVMTAIKNIFGKEKWHANSSPKKILPIIKPAAEKLVRIVNDESSVQGAIRLAMPFVERTHKDYPLMILLNTLFGGYFGSRLMSNIREEKGYTYGIYSYIYNNKNLGAFAISTEAGKDVCEATIQEVFNEMKILKEELIDEEELQLVKNYILGGVLGDLDGPFQIIQRWKNLILNNFDIERFNNNLNIYKNANAKELMELANKYLEPNNFYNLIVT